MNTPAPHSVFWIHSKHYRNVNRRARTDRALASQSLDLPVRVHLVILEDGHLDLFTLVPDLLGGVVRLLLPLLGTTTETANNCE
jgi:hypothetical protein